MKNNDRRNYVRSLKHTVMNIDVLFYALFHVWYSGINGKQIGMYLNLEV